MAPERQERVMDSFETGPESETVEKILSRFLDKENAIMITEIENPMALAQILAYSGALRKNHLRTSSRLLKTFVDDFVLLSVSHDRKNASGILEAIKGRFQEPERSLMDKLTNPEKPNK